MLRSADRHGDASACSGSMDAGVGPRFQERAPTNEPLKSRVRRTKRTTGAVGGNSVRRRIQYAIGAILVGLAIHVVPDAARASGSYRSRPSAPPSSVDRSQYELGKKVFLGEFLGSAGGAPDATAQAEALRELQSKLPASVRGRVDLSSLGGSLSTEEMDALRYFLKRRYKVE